MAISMQWISLFLSIFLSKSIKSRIIKFIMSGYLSAMNNSIFVIDHVKGVLYDLINILSPFASFCNHDIFIKSNLPIFGALVRQREKSQIRL